MDCQYRTLKYLLGIGKWGNGEMGEWGEWGNGGIQLKPQHPNTLKPQHPNTLKPQHPNTLSV
ncbi:conserved hypothetical protein [Microcystis aeruginosa PCC 9443]|uniref:Uncharacterized protein n=1 Tax=Microcystis aeruginosa PCC 9443 TaxID=1160281 RepID=I4G2S3_MICAE|nr:conserved hypothetical protein [Microcystis aeruginosa PCC 9443]